MDPVTYDADLRERLRANLAAHERVELPLEDRRAAAVAIVLVDSDPQDHDREPLAAARLDMTMVPGATVDADGSETTVMEVAGQPSGLGWMPE